MNWWGSSGFFLSEAWTSLRREKRLTVCACSVLALAFFILGVLLILLTNAARVIDSWRSAAPLTVFLVEGTEYGQRRAIEEFLSEEPALESHRFVSREEALAGLEEDLGSLTDLITTLGSNPLPDAYVATLKPGVGDTEALARIASSVEGLAGVESVEYGASWIGRWWGAIKVLKGSLHCLAVALGAAAVFIVAQTLRIKMHAHAHEMEIMALVGASRRFIWIPFVFEGAVQGLFASIAALVLLCASFSLFRAKVADAMAPDGVRWAVSFLSPGMSVLFVLAGVALGCLGSLACVRYRMRD